MLKNKLRALLLVTTLVGISPALANTLAAGIEGFKKNDYITSLTIFALLASEGDAEAQIYMGYMHEHGLGIPQNYKTAARWYSLAVKKNSSHAQFNLAHLHFNGLGFPQNYQTALNLYKKSAESGFAPAQNNLGYMYENGIGVKVDYSTAFNWYKKAANQSYPLALISLGHLLENGKGTTKNLAEAKRYYEKVLRLSDLTEEHQGFVQNRLITIDSTINESPKQIAENKFSNEDKKIQNKSQKIDEFEGKLNNQKLRIECPIAQENIQQELKVKKPNKPGNYVYITTKSIQTVCVLDANDVLTVKTIPANAHHNFTGSPPFNLMVENFNELSVYYQGSLVKPKQRDIKSLRLVETVLLQDQKP